MRRTKSTYVGDAQTATSSAQGVKAHDSAAVVAQRPLLAFSCLKPRSGLSTSARAVA